MEVSEPSTAIAQLDAANSQALPRALRKELRRVLPKEAFQPRTATLRYVAFLWLQLALAYWLMVRTSSTLGLWLEAIYAGHTLLCMALAGHTISHGSVIRGRWLYPLQLFVWTPAFVSSTSWIELHNKQHHSHVNTTKDIYLYRYFTENEKRWGSRLFSYLFLPNRYLPWNPLVLLHPIPFTLFPVFSVLFGLRMPPSPEQQSSYDFSREERVKVIFEFSLMIGYQFAIGWLVGPSKWVFAGYIPMILGMMLGAGYINTQHYLHPASTRNDPIGSSTSLRLPRIVQWLHFNIGYHIEHHVYPSMDGHYYPLVAAVLKQQLGARYHEVGVFEAYRQMFKNEPWKTPQERASKEGPELFA